MPKQKNTAIGEVECAQKGCELKASIFKFREGGKNPNTWARRWAGKLYSTCKAGHTCRDQEYLLKGELWGPGAKAVEVADPVKAQSSDAAPAQQTPPATVTLELGGTIPASPAAAANAGKKVTFGFWNFTAAKGKA